MDKYHVNYKGEAGKCAATSGGCPFGGDADHFTSADEARLAYEHKAAEHFVLVGVKKTIEGNVQPAKVETPPKPKKKGTPEQERLTELMRRIPRDTPDFHLKKIAEDALEAYKLAKKLGQNNRVDILRKEIANGIKEGLGPRGLNHYYREVLEDFTDEDWESAGAKWPKKKRDEVMNLWPKNSPTHKKLIGLDYRIKTSQMITKPATPQATYSPYSYGGKGNYGRGK